MEVLLYVLIGVLFISSVLLLIFYMKENKKNKELSKENKNIIDNNTILLNSIEIIKNDIDTTNNKGYYKTTVNLISGDDKTKTEPYVVIVYVKEKERYTNGLSEIRLDKIEILSGIDMYQYEWVIKGVRERFVSLRETKDINWLEPIISLNKQRVEKINIILEKIKEKKMEQKKEPIVYSKSPMVLRNESFNYDGDNFDVFIKSELDNFLKDADLTTVEKINYYTSYIRLLGLLYNSIEKDNLYSNEKNINLSKRAVVIINEYIDKIKNNNL